MSYGKISLSPMIAQPLLEEVEATVSLSAYGEKQVAEGNSAHSSRRYRAGLLR